MEDNVADDRLIIMLDKVSEIAERTARIEVQMQSVVSDVNHIKEEDKQQNRLLDEHIQGTIANTQRLNLEIQNREEIDARLKKIEKIPQFFNSIYSILMYAGVIIGIVYETGRILHKW